MIDYIVVGLGLAGLAFCEQLEKDGKNYVVFENNSQCSSTVAGGLYNPVILKRFTSVWNADEQLSVALPFYEKLEEKFNKQFDQKIEVLRRFASIEEQNMWFEASDKPKLSPYLDTELIANTNEAIDASYSYGRVKQTGRIHTEKLLNAYRAYLKSKNRYIEANFDHKKLSIETATLHYEDIIAKKIVFCEGFGLKKNPLFNYLPLNGTKGELITIKTSKLEISNVIKSSVFIIPIGNDLYKIGATYNWEDKSNTPTEEAKIELTSKLETFLKCEYTVVDQVAGIRPTVIDRKPLVGKHPKYPHIAVLNGLGTRGVMIAPTVSQQLYNSLENDISLPKEINIKRFEELYGQS